MRNGFRVLVLFSALAATPAFAPGPSLQDRQQAACYDDVMRLCSAAVPDIDRVTACMQDKRSQVSAPCAAFYPPRKR
ncbi:hypothetical protein P7D22_22185 [Lichenihabitans sp. Uapishka_5]|uniref:hypothetical protein n=1 Tax=Lichenihabitans sp. Uapishka_5 TaxID=3037302 RepID=UPI0029E80219|nr:hypothetical protein [Lichenihabitans sp. Uapishka_5]MDX7953868.1 hypothetical protein [Lichenihabitans sp. Uapishka_5]